MNGKLAYKVIVVVLGLVLLATIAAVFYVKMDYAGMQRRMLSMMARAKFDELLLIENYRQNLYEQGEAVIIVPDVMHPSVDVTRLSSATLWIEHSLVLVKTAEGTIFVNWKKDEYEVKMNPGDMIVVTFERDNWRDVTFWKLSYESLYLTEINF